MRSLFYMCCKLFGVYLCVNAVHYAVTNIIWIGSLIRMNDWNQGYPLIVFGDCILYSISAYICLCKATALADILHVPEQDAQSISAAGLFHIGLLMLGLVLAVLSIERIILNNFNFVGMKSMQKTSPISDMQIWIAMLRTTGRSVLQLLLAFIMLKYPGKVMGWLNIGTPQAAD